ncbi:2-amino-3-carboxymuconate-6-semialdehyde decarboxylase-like, partial [Exaiptasia diaphana]|uniref:2-amino-3-carboxymuconate-6-semialdehyde decarboxylase n=1 Tax=Exaiptasia diaphana TaxID=2652724 RepID=A0A913YR58_EXADI
MSIIDAWMQHPNPEFLNQPYFESLRRWMGDQIVREQIPPQQTVASMDAANVQLGLLSAWWGPQGPMLSNDFVAEVVEQFPDRFRGVASVDLRTPIASIHELRRCVHELGFKALRMIQWLWGAPPTDRLYYPLFAECVHLDIP